MLKRLIERRIVHPQRFQNVILDVTLKLFAAHTLDDVSGKRESKIGIRRNFTRRENTSGHFIHEIRAQRFDIAFVRDEEILQYFLESAGVSKQLPQRDRLRISFWDWKIEVFIHVAVEIELSLFDQLH